LSSSSSSSSSRDDDYDDGTEKKMECDDCPSPPTTDPPSPPPPIPPGGTADNNDPHGGGGGGGGPALLLLQPYLPALDPAYPARGPVGVSGKFVISRSGPPTREELSNDNMLMIVRSECTDLEVNTLVWKCLGYRFDADGECWDAGEVFPKWRESYPHPPDLLGMRRVYSRDVDTPSLRSNQALVRSIPVEHKQSLKTHLNPLGFTGFKLKELTPNKTRRAQCANWLIFYREELFGYTVEELRERRRSRRAAEDEAAEAMRRKEAEEGREGGATTEEWKPPVEEVF
jgi:hypothetical protein